MTFPKIIYTYEKNTCLTFTDGRPRPDLDIDFNLKNRAAASEKLRMFVSYYQSWSLHSCVCVSLHKLSIIYSAYSQHFRIIVLSYYRHFKRNTLWKSVHVKGNGHL